MKLVLAEKPSVAQSIAKVLGAAKREDGYLEGNGYVVSWCVGHLVELAQPEVYDAKYSKWAYADLPIFPMDWQYEVSAGTKKQFGILKKLMAREDVASLVCATDAGREGELIFRLVYHKAGCRKPFERLWMASIVKRKKKYSVVYTYTDENGNKRQKWETFETNSEAKKRKLQVEYEQESGTFIPPSAKTVNDLLDEYMSIYGVNTWAMSTYESRKSLIANYIRPLIGDMKLEDVTPRIMDKYYRDLLSVKAVSSKYVKARTEYLTPHTVREVHKTLRNAFNQAVKWELMTRNPVEHATLPKEEHKTRDIWTAEVLQKALEACDDDILRLAINLAFSCSLRMGELLGLTWDCIDISPTSIELGQASIFVEKELQRVNREAMADLDGKDIMFKFPPTFASTHTALVLKTPKTKTSVRKVFLPKTVAEMLVQRKADIEELKDLFGDEFVDFNLVFCSSNGKPIEGQVINRAFNKLIEEKGLPKVVFHSLRHSSITYKLKLNGGDMKSVQGDSGHAQVKMVADVYSHIIDDDRRLNAERMEAAFYSGRQATPEPVQPAATESSADDKELLLKLLQNPEMAALLKSLAKTL